MTQPEKLLTAEQLAAHLHVKARTVSVWARKRLIPAIWLSSRVVRFDLAVVIETLAARHTKRSEQRDGGKNNDR